MYRRSDRQKQLRGWIAAGSAVALLVTPAALGQKGPSTSEFVRFVSSFHTFVIEAGEVAVKKAKSQAVLRFAEGAIEDHREDLSAFKAALAVSGEAAIPAIMTASHQRELSRLRAAPEFGFGSLYVDVQVAAHQGARTVIAGYLETTDSRALKSYAIAVLALVQRHQGHIQRIDEQM
jgi:putative membrane protein